MLLDASAGGSMTNKVESEARELIEAIAQNEYRVQNDRGAKKKPGMFELDTGTTLLARQAKMNTHIEPLLKVFTNQATSQAQVNATQGVQCDFCGQGHANGQCFSAGSEEANYLANFKRSNPNNNPFHATYNSGWRDYPNFGWGDNKKKPQQQLDDPRSLTIPCSIGEVNFKEAPCDLDSNINSMSLYHVDRLKEVHDEQKDQEKQLVEIETDQRNASSVRDEDFYKGAEPQTMKSQEQDPQQKEQPSNKAEEKAEIDKVIDMICALFATVKLKRVWKQYPLFLKFLGFLTKKRRKTDDIFHLSYKTP
ncbi:hypothetical protein QL285_075975 [Trifolium repens]|nr:hypothetical protein QL285_075975 [Trifolium repens]